MIDWYALFFNSFWIIGLAVIVATLSYNYWLAQVSGERWRDQFDKKMFLRPAWTGVVFITIGLAGTAVQWWETALWLAFLLYALFILWQTWHNTNNLSPNELTDKEAS